MIKNVNSIVIFQQTFEIRVYKMRENLNPPKGSVSSSILRNTHTLEMLVAIRELVGETLC